MFTSWFDGTVRMNLNRYNGMLGSTSVVDTNDPTYDGTGLSFGGDDYVGIPLFFNVSNNWTIYIMVKREGNPSTNETFLSIGNSSSDNPYVVLQKRTVGDIIFQIRGDNTTIITTITGIIANSGFNLIRIKRIGDTIIVKNLTSNSEGTGNFNGIQTGLNKLTFGSYSKISNSLFLSGQIAYGLMYNRNLSNNEDTQNYHVLKQECARLGVLV